MSHMDELTHISLRKSKWRMWKRCPRLYELIWIKGYAANPSVEQQFGTMFHAGARAFFDVVKDDKLQQCKDAREALAYFNTIFDPQHPVVGPLLRKFFVFEANAWGYLKSVAGNPIKYWRPLATELEMLSQPKGFEMHIDRIDLLSDSNLIVIEYKVEKYVNLSDLRQELTFYSIGINSSGGYATPVTQWGYYNPLKNIHIAEPLKQRTIQYVNRQVLQCRRGIASGNFEPRPQRLCRYCSQNFRCLAEGVFDEDFIA